MRPFISHIISFLLIALITGGSAISLGLESHLSEKICSHATQEPVNSSNNSPCSTCPDEDHSGSHQHSGSHHCTFVCDCCSHLQVSAGGIQLFYSPSTSNLLPQDSFKSPPDIYLSIFVPPDRRA